MIQIKPSPDITWNIIIRVLSWPTRTRTLDLKAFDCYTAVFPLSLKPMVS